MGSQVTLVYHIDATGAVSTAALQAKMAVVPVPPDLLRAFALRVTSDGTFTVGSIITRTIVLSFLPTAAATASANLVPGDPSGSPVESVTVNGAGDGYVQPPAVVFPPPPNDVVPPATALAKAYLECKSTLLSTGGTGYGSTSILPLVTFVGGLPPADVNNPPFAVNALSLIKKGRRYTASAVVQFKGSLAPGGHHAAATLTRDATGAITSVTLIDPGSGYLTIPDAFIFDPGNASGGVDPENAAEVVVQPGSGTPATAHAAVALGVITSITLDTGGIGYVSIPAVVITDPTGVGSGAKATVSMGVGEIVMIYGGKGYLAAAPPTVTLTPFFKSMFPDLASVPATLVSQAKPFWDFMTSALVQGTLSPVRADAPVVS